MNAQVVGAARGMRWIAEGCRLFFMAPLSWLVLAFSYLMAAMILVAIPVVGMPLYLVLYPAAIVMFMIASRAAALRQSVDVRMLFPSINERLRPLLGLGGAYAAGMALAVLGSWLADDGALLRFLTRSPTPGEPALVPAEVRDGLLMVLVLYLPTFMMIFYAPLLVAWHRMPPLQALFYSFFACLLNWRAFAIYVLVGVVLMVVTANVALVLALALAGAEVRANPAQLLPTLGMSTLLIILPVVMASSYASYRDVFGAGEGS